MKEKKNWTKWIYWFTFAVATIIIYKTLDNFNDITNWFGRLISVLMPFIIGTLCAYLLYIPCRRIENLFSKLKILRRIARPLSVFTTYIIVILLIVLMINIVLPALSKSLVDLANNLPGYFQNVIEMVNNMPEDYIVKKENIQSLISGLQSIDIMQFINLETLTDYAKSIMGFASGIFNVFVSFIVSIYILLERGRILKFIRKVNRAFFKEETCKSIDSYFAKTNDVFFKFISSQVLDAIIVGVIVSIVLLIMKVKYAILLGFVIGLFNIIPYFGAIIGVLIATIITIFTGGFVQAIWMIIVVVILQQIDANIINPKILGNALKLSPILVIFAVTLFGAYFGVMGMFLSVPIVAVIKMLVNDYLDYKIKRL